MDEPIGFDSYNLCLTGGVCRTMSATRSDNEHIPCVMIKKEEPMLLESNQNHATISQNGVCTTLSASMGLGGGYIPMIVEKKEPLIFDARGNGNGAISCTITGGHESTISDYTAIVMVKANGRTESNSVRGEPY